MEKKNNCVKSGFSRILWAVTVILLCAPPCGWAVDITEPIPGPYFAEGEVNVYANITWGLVAKPGSTVNIHAGAIGDGVLYGITVCPDTTYETVTVYGTDFALDGELLDPIPDQVTFIGGSGTLTVTYNDNTTVDLLFWSDFPIHLVNTAGGESFVESVEYIIAEIEKIDVPKAEKEMDKAVTELYKAIDEFSNDRIDKAFDKIAKAVKHLMKAQKKGADTQAVIDQLVALVRGITYDAIEAVGADNPHVIKAQKHYNKALQNIEEGKYDRAIKEFKKAYKEAMKDLGENGENGEPAEQVPEPLRELQRRKLEAPSPKLRA